MIEQLENRLMLIASLVNGTLTITSSVIGENYTVTLLGSNIVVDTAGDGFHAQYAQSSVTRLVITSIQANRAPNSTGDFFMIDPGITVPTTINASMGDDTIFAGGGDTIVNPIANPPSMPGNDGADFIEGGAGNDTLNGGGGRAVIGMTPAADDTIIGGGGNDLLLDGGSTDNANLGAIMIGGAGNDTIQGGPGRDIMDAGAGTDTLDYSTSAAGSGIDVVFPFAGPSAANATFDNTMPITAANFPFLGFGAVSRVGMAFQVTEHDQLYDGLGSLSTNQLTYNNITANDVNLLNDDNVEVILGSNRTDDIDVSFKSAAYTIIGNDGIDTINGGSGNDVIDLGNVSNQNAAGIGRDGTNNFDNANGGAGNDTINGGGTVDAIDGGVGNDSLFGNAGNDQIAGGVGNDILDGGIGNDLLVGDEGDAGLGVTVGDGNDTLLGGAGGPNDKDTLQGDGGIDTADYSGRTTAVQISFDMQHDDGDATVIQPDLSVGEQDFVTESTEVALGGSANDLLTSTVDLVGRQLDGNGGNDTLLSGTGSDALNGGAGNDSIVTGRGADSVDGGAGIDILDYSSFTLGVNVSLDAVGNDGVAGDNANVDNIESLLGGSGADNLDMSGSNANVSVNGNNGNDTITGSQGNSTLNGGNGNDVIHGGPGTAMIHGDAGNDTLDGTGGPDTLDGGTGGDDMNGDGNDLVDYSARTGNVNVSFDDQANDGEASEGDNIHDGVSTVMGGSGDDTLTATVNSKTLYGLNGNDTIQGGSGDDRLVGGNGDDSINGGSGRDTLIGGAGADIMLGGGGVDSVSYYNSSQAVIAKIDGLPDSGSKGEDDTIGTDIYNLTGGTGNDQLFGTKHANILDGGAGNDSLVGFNGNDLLTGDAGSDTLNGGNNNDTLDGGLNGDRLIGGKGIDTADYSSRTTNLSLSIDNRANDGATGEFDKIDADVEVLLGGSGNDRISAGAFPVTINGGAGNDTIRGGPGADSLIGGLGSDSIVGNVGGDTIVANDGVADTINAGSGADSILQDVGLDTVV
jgi:Ca2+-binding RTX toxin-like protein